MPKRKHKKKIKEIDTGNNNLIHIRLEYIEAIKVKKDFLSIQMSFLNIMKKINRYREYRTIELDLKSRLYRKSKESKASTNDLQKTLPNLEIPEILRKNHKIFQEKPKHTEQEKSKIDEFEVQDMDIEGQLREIQSRLNQLQNEESLIK